MANDGASSLKLSLKSKILLRRQKEGLKEIKVDFTARPSYPMTDEEKMKDEKRRLSNRKSAQKSREKQKLRWEKDENDLHILQNKQKILSKRISELESEKSSYMSALMKYIPESSVNAVLEEKVDYENLTKTTESVTDTAEGMDEDSDESGGSITDVLEISNIPFFSDSEFTNDYFFQSNYHDTFVTMETTTESFGMDDVNALDILNSVIEENA